MLFLWGDMMKVKLGDIGVILTGNTPKTSDEKNYISKDINFIKPSDIDEDKITDISTSDYFISELAKNDARILPVGSILVTCIGIIGKVGINSIECAFNQQINAIIPDTRKCNNKFLAYAIQFKKNELQQLANAPVVPILNKTQFSNIQICLPLIEEQNKVVANLDIINEIINKRQQQLKKLDELVKSRFIEMFGDPYFNFRKWNVVLIKDICVLLKSGLSRKLSGVDIGIPVIRSININEGQFDSTDLKYWYICDPQGANIKDYLLNDGDLLINFINSQSQIGKCCIYKDIGRPCIYTTNILRMILKNECNKFYFNYLAQTKFYKQKINIIMQPAVNQASFTTTNFLKIEIPLPPLNLQNEFADFVKQTDKSKLEIQKSLDKLEILKKSLMQQYFG